MKAEDLRDAALALPENERAALVCALLESIETEDDIEPGDAWATAWGAEISRRLDTYAADGRSLPADEVMAEARARIGALRR